MFSIVTIYIFFMDLMRRLFHINHTLAHYITTDFRLYQLFIQMYVISISYFYSILRFIRFYHL